MFSSADEHIHFMRRALELAVHGRGSVEPNPMVGCVIVRGGRVLGEGFHERYGGPHSEAAALVACTEPPRGATAYVTLEPCCHTSKQTPPCAPRLIEAGIARVVVACVDPNPQVSGGGIEQLRSAGIAVDIGLLEAEARQLNAAFFCQMRQGRPYVTLKWAEGADGKIAGADGRPSRISNATSLAAIHRLRGRCDAIAVGINTVLSDDPLLTARGVGVVRPLMRVVLDRRLRIPLECRLVRTADEHPLWVMTSVGAMTQRREKVAALRRVGVEVMVAGELGEVMNVLGGTALSQGEREDEQTLTPALSRGPGRGRVTHLLVEPGPTLAEAFFTAGLADRVWVIRSPRTIDAADAPAAARVPADFVEVARADLDGDLLTEYLNPRGPAFFAPAASADMVLLR